MRKEQKTLQKDCVKKLIIAVGNWSSTSLGTVCKAVWNVLRIVPLRVKEDGTMIHQL